MKFKMLTLATASLLAIAIPAAGHAAKPVLGRLGLRQVGNEQLGQARRRFLGLCERQLGSANANPRRPCLGRLLRHSSGRSRNATSGRSSKRSPVIPNEDPVAQQIGDYYSTFMDEGAIEAAGTAPLKPYLARIDAVQSRSQLQSLFVKPGYARPIDIGISRRFQESKPLFGRSRAKRASACQAANIISVDDREDGRASGGVPRTTSSRSRSWPDCPAAKPPPTGSSRSRPRCRRPSGRLPSAAISTRPTIR